ncbi:MAG: glycerol kinase GlpK, partial [Clostridiales Family XIII bacterium]|nr:glycerol kinase GlpK [Clostridiales Family XIII bacterium]
MRKYVMSMDQGTTSSRTIIFDREGGIVAKAQKEITQYYPAEDRVEHDPYEILASQISSAKEAMSMAGLTCADICGIGVTNQRETTVVWDSKTGDPVYPAIVWQDRRTAGYCSRLTAEKGDGYFREKTGLIADPYFSASKIAWILDNVPDAREDAEAGKLLFGTVDSWLIWKLTGGARHVTDYSNAARTLLFDIAALDWDSELLALFGIPKSMMPEVVPSSGIVGETAEGIFGGRIKIAGIAGDQQASLFGLCCFGEGDAKITYGTGCFMLMNTGHRVLRSSGGLISTIAWSDGKDVTYALEGSVFIGGAVVQWLRDEVRFFDEAAESEGFAESVADTNGVYMVPAFTGLGAPYWDANARGAVFGLTRGARREHLIRAALESIAYQNNDLIEAMRNDSGLPISSLKADGGASENNFLMQFQADISEAQVERGRLVETTALGAAYLAGLAVSYWNGKDDIVASRR